jgi:hypothetical protein
MSADPDWDGLRKRLDVIIMLMMERGPDGANSTSGKIEKLLGFGFTASEVAQVVGKKLNYVTAVMSSGKRKGKKASKPVETVPEEQVT